MKKPVKSVQVAQKGAPQNKKKKGETLNKNKVDKKKKSEKSGCC